jgi:hypothetical protein
MSDLRELMFVNSDATPKISAVHVSTASVSAVMAWYGSYYAGDRYYVQVDGKRVEKDRNGELVGGVPVKGGG